MKYIELTKGQRATVDDEDWPYLSQFRWWFDGMYAQGRVNGKQVRMHRLLLNPPKGSMVDHANGDRMDNTRANIRVCSHGENEWNKAKKHRHRNDGHSKYKGVTRDVRRGMWVSRTTFNGRSVHIGSFVSEIDAARAFDDWAREHHGQFAHVNFPLMPETLGR